MPSTKMASVNRVILALRDFNPGMLIKIKCQKTQSCTVIDNYACINNIFVQYYYAEYIQI